MKEDVFKKVVREVLGQLKLQVKDLEPRQNLPTPDFEVLGKKDRYVIELKIKGDDPEQVRRKDEELRRGGVVGTYTPVGPRNTLAGVIREGIEQMTAWDPQHRQYRVLWLHSSGRDSELLNDRLQATLFGIETLFSLNVEGLFRCYYFHNSAFHRWRYELDGVVLTYPQAPGLSVQLCINTLSSRQAQFRSSELARALSNALLDPDKEDGIDKGGMIADCDMDRKDSNKVLAYLQRKYDLGHLQAIPMNKVRGEILLDDYESD